MAKVDEDLAKAIDKMHEKDIVVEMLVAHRTSQSAALIAMREADLTGLTVEQARTKLICIAAQKVSKP